MMDDFVLKKTETVPGGIKRIIGSQIDFALFNIQQNIDKDFDEAVHESRKCSKRVRAVLRLVQDEIGMKLYKRDNYHFRDINRYLSEVRNISVIIDTLNNVAKNTPDHDFSALINYSIGLKDKIVEILFAEEDRLIIVAEHLAAGKERATKLPVKSNDIITLHKGMHKVYMLCVDRMNKAIKEPSNENLHEWRKQVKYLYYQFQVLTPYIHDELVAHIPNLDKIADYLGDDHDLAELEYFLNNVAGTYPQDYGISELANSIGSSRQELQSQVFSLAGEVFNKDTEEYINNLISY